MPVGVRPRRNEVQRKKELPKRKELSQKMQSADLRNDGVNTRESAKVCVIWSWQKIEENACDVYNERKRTQ